MVQGPKTFLSAVVMQDPIQPKSACLISTDPSEHFFSIEKFPANDTFLASSNRRIILFVLKQDELLEAVDTLCVFPTNPLLCSALRRDKIFCLESRGVSLVELKDSSQSSEEKQRKNATAARPELLASQPQIVPKAVQAISKSPVKKQSFEVPSQIPRFSDEPAEKAAANESAKQVALPFDVGRVRRIYYDKENDQLLFGGEVLNYLVRSPNGTYQILDKKVPMSFFSVFHASTGYLILNDTVSNDLLVLNRQNQEVNRYSGVPDLKKIDNENFKYVQQHRDFMLWLAGPARVVKIHLNLLMEDIKMFDSEFVEKFNPYIYLLQGSSKGALYCVVMLEGRGTAIAVLKNQKTEVVLLSTLPGERTIGLTQLSRSTRCSTTKRMGCSCWAAPTTWTASRGGRRACSMRWSSGARTRSSRPRCGTSSLKRSP